MMIKSTWIGRRSLDIKMDIKKAQKKDIKEISKLMLEEFSKPPFNEEGSLEDVINSLDYYFGIGKVYYIEDNKKIIGLVNFCIEQYWEGSVIIIEDLAVKEEFKKQGISKYLMDFVEDFARKNNIGAIYFSTNKKSKAVRFYQKIGYKIKKDIIFMGKKLK